MNHMIRFEDSDDPNSVEESVVGDKGANLGLLTRAGFPVPPGFTVTTSAYREFIEKHGFVEAIQSIVSQIDFDDATNVEKRTAKIRSMIEAAPMSASASDGIRARYAELGSNGRVAVRSSRILEGPDDASFAGRYDTYLHIRGADEVIDAVKRCWASLWTARATAYRAHKKSAQCQAGIAVVVQAMVDSEVSGVMYTANPIYGLTTEICIDSSWGLGEAVVSGMVTPDHFTLDSQTFAVKERTLGTKEKRIGLDDSVGAGTLTAETPGPDRARHSLTEQQLIQLGRLGRRVMDHHDGLPQEIEWALADGKVHLLQSRRMTGALFTWGEDVAFWRSEPLDADRPFALTFAGPLEQEQILAAPDDCLGMFKAPARIQLLNKEMNTVRQLWLVER